MIGSMRAFTCLAASSRRRWRRLGTCALATLRAEKGSRAHSHVLWLGLAGAVVLGAQPDALGWYAAPSLALLGGLSVIVLFDIEYFVIPDGPLLFLLGTGVLTLLLGAREELWSRLACALGAWAALRLLALGYERWRGVTGLGAADPKLFGIAGLWLGLHALPGCLLISAISGLISAAILLRERQLTDGGQPLPFGPHLALGLWLSWVLGPLESG
jgi:leader peptidase (prepilin peptidase)/N-methyltransferase